MCFQCNQNIEAFTFVPAPHTPWLSCGSLTKVSSSWNKVIKIKYLFLNNFYMWGGPLTDSTIPPLPILTHAQARTSSRVTVRSECPKPKWVFGGELCSALRRSPRLLLVLWGVSPGLGALNRVMSSLLTVETGDMTQVLASPESIPDRSPWAPSDRTPAAALYSATHKLV